jgi:hypothetical protein
VGGGEARWFIYFTMRWDHLAKGVSGYAIGQTGQVLRIVAAAWRLVPGRRGTSM